MTRPRIYRGYREKLDLSDSKIFIYDGSSDFEAPHSTYFNFDKHQWTDNFLELAHQPLLCRGFEQVGGRRRGDIWAATYYLGYLNSEGLYFVRRSDIVQMRKDVVVYLKAIQVEGLVLGTPPCSFDKMKPFYKKGDRQLHFQDLEMLKRFIVYCWGPEAVNLINQVTPESQQNDARLKSLEI